MLKNAKNSRKQGDVGLGMAVAYGTRNGYTVLLPLTDNQSYDICYDMEDGLKRISVKTTFCLRDEKYFQVNLRVFGGNKSGQHVTKFDSSKVEYVFVLCDDGTQYFIPSKNIKSTTSLVLYSPWDKYKI